MGAPVADPVDGPVIYVKGGDVQPGDVLMFLGTEHVVHRLRQYGKTSLPHIFTPDTRVACSGPTWEMTLFADELYRIRPRVTASAEGGGR